MTTSHGLRADGRRLRGVARGTRVSAEELLARDDLKTILLYHVTGGRRYSPSITNPGDVEMLAGGTVTTDGTVLNDGQAEISDADVGASNGVGHVIDGVLLP